MKIIRSKGLFAMIGEEEKPHIFIDKSEEFRKCLEEIRELCKCSKDLNCKECPQRSDCEELCLNDENLQNIITNKINEVLGNE